MALHIRDDRAAQLARELAERRGVTMTQAVLTALEAALAQENRPLSERLRAIAGDARRLSDPAQQREVSKQEIDKLWGHD